MSNSSELKIAEEAKLQAFEFPSGAWERGDRLNLSKAQFLRHFCLVCLLLAICGDQIEAAKSELEKQEQAGYPVWRKKFRNFEEPTRNMPRAADDPSVPFDVGRMYKESDAILECALGNYLTATDHLKLVVRIADIGGVYKGQIPVTTLEPQTANLLSLCVMQDELGNHESLVRLQSDEQSRYLLFLKKVPDDERKLRGYGDLHVTLFKVYRVWHGAVRLDGKTYLDGDANFQLYHDKRFNKLPLSPPDILDAVKLLAANGAASEGAMMRVAWESRYLSALTQNMNGTIRETVPDEFRSIPTDVLETFTGEILRSRYATCKEPPKKLALAARIRFRTILWKDLSAIVPE